MIPYAIIMDEQIPRLEAFFKHLVVDKDDDNGDVSAKPQPGGRLGFYI
jgi:hypothetical protein